MASEVKNIHKVCLGDLLLADLPVSVSNISVLGITIDSREVKAGYAFVAVQGIQQHGKEFIGQAIDNGAVVILIQSQTSNVEIDGSKAAPIIFLPELNSQLSAIAGRFYQQPSHAIPVMGVTGTNGKTSCSQLYAQLSALLQKNCGVLGTMGYGVCSGVNAKQTQLSLVTTGMTTPDPIRTQKIVRELVDAGSESIAMEVSSHGLDQGRVADITFDTVVFTNLSHDHLDYHGDMESYGAAKTKLFLMTGLKRAVLNKDDAYSEVIKAKISQGVEILFYSVENAQADICLSHLRYQSNATSATLHTPLGSWPIQIQMSGRFNLSNLLAVIAAHYPHEINDVEKQNFSFLVESLSYLKPVPGRMELISNATGRQVFVDYAHTPDALENILQAVKELGSNQLWCVFGCGGDRDKDKRPLMAKIAEQYADRIVVTSDNPRHEDPSVIVEDIVAGFAATSYEVCVERQQAIHTAINASMPGDIIVIAGKGHEDYQLIGDNKLPFSDQDCARLALRSIEQINNVDSVEVKND